MFQFMGSLRIHFIEPFDTQTHAHTHTCLSVKTYWGRWNDTRARWSGSRIDDYLRRSWRRWTGGQMEVGVSCNAGCVCFSPTEETKTGLNLQLNPWPAFDLVYGTGGAGQKAGHGEGSGCEMGACCCFEVPPRIWKRPIKQDHKSGTAFLLNLTIHTINPKNSTKHLFRNMRRSGKLSESNVLSP